MPVIINAAVGDPNANSYATFEEANAYFDSRVLLDPEWEDADDPEAALVMATRVLDAFTQKLRVYHPAGPTGGSRPFYVTRRTWTGAPATTTQRLAWPRVGMFDQNWNPLDFAITASVADPTIVTTSVAHRLVDGQTVLIMGSDSTPSIDGNQVATVLSPTTFSIPVAVTEPATTGRMTYIPQALKDAQSELAGQLLIADTTRDNDVRVQGIKSVKAGSVAISFKDMIQQHVLPDSVWLLLVASWLTDEIWESVQTATFDVVSK